MISPRFLLLIAYPPLAHLAVTSGSRVLMATALTLLLIVALSQALGAGRRGAWLTLGAALPAIGLISAFGAGLWLMVALSLALPSLVAAGFLASLRCGHTPLVTVMAMRVQRPLPPPLVHYTRRLTQFWAAVIVTLIAVELGLALLASAAEWSRYANGYAYLILGTLFVVEYLYRRRRFRSLPQPGPVAYLKLLLSPHTQNVQPYPGR